MEEGRVYRAGIIGCGRIASNIEDEIRKVPGFMLFPYTHAGAYERYPRTQLVAGADIREEALNDFGDRWGVASLYTDYREMLEREQLDIVSIAALSSLHHEMTLEVAKYPVKGIFLEKPVALSLEEADEMISVCQSAGIKVAVNHTRTFDPYYRAAKGLIESGEIGELRAVMSTWVEGFSFGGSHLFDLLRFMMGAKADWVFCDLDKDPSLKDPGGDVYMVYKNGVRVHVHMPKVSTAPATVELIGSKGRIRLGPFNFQLWKSVPVGPLNVMCECPFPGRNEGKSAMYTAVEELVRAIETGEEPASNLEAGREALEVIVALLISGKRGEVVKLPVTDRSFVAESMW